MTLRTGPYSIRGSYPGLASQELSVEIKGRDTQRRALDFPFATVSVQSTPPGATISVDGTNWLVGGRPAVTPYSVRPLKPGKVLVQLDLKDHQTTKLPEVELRTGQTTNLVASLIPIPEGEVQVDFESNFREVEVLLNGRPLSRTPFTKSLPPGRYPVTARREGWPEQRQELIVEPNKKGLVQIRFPRVRLSFDSDPASAKVFLGGRLLGETPFSDYGPTGVVAFRFEKPGYEITNVSANIWQDDDRATVSVPSPVLLKTNGVFVLMVEPVAATVTDVSNAQVRHSTSLGRPLEIERTPGKHQFRIEAPDYLPQTLTLDFRPKTRSNHVVHLLPQPLQVVMTSDPPGAELYDSAKTKLGPVGTTNLPARTYAFLAFHPRYPDLGWASNTLVVAKGGSNTCHFAFPHTTLVITSSPPDLKVYEVKESGERVSIGNTPITRPYQRPGPLTLDFISWDKTNTQRITFPLRPGPEQVGAYFRPPKPLPYVNSIGMVFEWIIEQGTNGGFWVGKYEVTQPEYEALMPRVSTHQYAADTNLPADSVSLTNALEFCRRLTERDKESLARAKDKPMSDWVYTLPTKAQWLYYAETDLTRAIIRTNRPTSVEKLSPNQFDLCGVRGNLWEWCLDGSPRGAAYNSREGLLRHLDIDAVLRLSQNQPTSRDVGFRCILVPPGMR
jgi:formylglycine-generating enzyme required for sulfatase activity